MACAPAGWDAESWAHTRPELVGRDLGHLALAAPYLLAVGDELVFFWCRWPERPIPIALPRNATAEERALLLRAFEAWEAAVPALRFAHEPYEPKLTLHFENAGPEGARAATHCSVQSPISHEGALQAAVSQAEVTLRRAEGDAFGRPVALSEAELLGSAIHEIGHALGLQGHARRGRSALSRNVDQVRKVGQRVLAGGALEEPAMRALYSLPAGSVIERRRLPAGTTAGLDAALARVRGTVAVVVTLGDRAAQVWTPASHEVAYWIKDPLEVFHRTKVFQGYLERGPAPLNRSKDPARGPWPAGSRPVPPRPGS